MAHQVLSPPSISPFTSPDGGHQLQMLEKLKQLRLWQHQQQEQLLAQQQQELVTLKHKQDAIKTRPGPSLPISSNPLIKLIGVSNDVPLNIDTPSQGLQPTGHTISGSSISSCHSADSGMLSGQSSAVDMLRRPSGVEGSYEGSEHSSGFQTPLSDVLSDSEEEKEEERRDKNIVKISTVKIIN